MALRVRGETVDEITGAVAADARQDAARRRRRPTRSTSSAPAATRPAPTTSRPARPSSSPAPACRSPSTATARCPRVRRRRRARPRSASRSICRPDEIARCICEAGIGFMFAPAHHPAMKHVGPTRVELGTRTIFNLLGPAVQPGRRQAPDDRRVLRAVGRAAGAGAEEPRLRARLGGARLRRPRRDHHLRRRPTSRRWRTARSAPSRSPPRTSACARVEAGRAHAAATPQTNAAALHGRAQGQEGPVSRHRAAERRGRAGRRRQAPRT